MSRPQLKKYIWIIDTVYSAGERGITLEEINKKWSDSPRNESGKIIKWRTFIDDRENINELFGIDIICDKHDNTYRVADRSSDYGSIKDTLVDALVLNNAIRESPDLKNSIVFHDNFHQKCMTDLVKAVKNHQVIRFRYQVHKSIPAAGLFINHDHLVTFRPYGLYNSTLWFTVGKTEAFGDIRIYALHHISDIEFLEETFLPPEDFDVKHYMSNFKVDDDDIEPDREPDDAFMLESFEADRSWDLRR